MLFEKIIISYFNPALNIGLQDVRNAWLMNETPVKLITTLHQGNLVYRIPRTRKRISYLQLKKGLVKKKITISQPVDLLPF
jgi:hypothetical protein